MNKRQAAEQFRRALQLFVATLSDETALEIATVLPKWEVGKAYTAGERFTYKTNQVGDPQIYKVAQAHTSAAEWTPDDAASLYTPVGIGESGHDQWIQPTGAHDAYVRGDIVEYNGALYICVVESTVYAPDVYGWEAYSEE